MEERVLHFDTQQAITEQANYCDRNHLPMIAPGMSTHGCCKNCHNPIYIIGGISIEEARTTYIIGCPYCHTLFES